MKRNKLYMVNKYNQSALNCFGGGGKIGAFDFKNAFGKQGLKAAGEGLIGGLAGGLGTAVGGLAGGAIAGGLESGAGSAISNVGGMAASAIGSVNPLLGAAVGVGSQVVGGLVNRAFGTKVDQAKLDAVNGGIAQNSNFVSNASSFEDVEGPAATTTDTGAYSGGWFSGGKADRKNEELKRRLMDARSFAFRSVGNNIDNLVNSQMNDALGNYSAFGGPLGLSYNNSGALGLMQQDKYFDAINNRSAVLAGKQPVYGKMQPQSFAFGGELGTNGTDWTNGLLYIDSGGRHEENPLEGVPIGFDPEGTPNLVEEGETIWNDYVFSDRMKVPEEMLKELGLGGSMSKDISFADASKKLGKESEQRPNDPISMAGLEASMSRLAEVQEAERMKQQMKEYVGLSGFACGGRLNKFAGPGNKSQKLNRYGYYTNGSDGLGTPVGFKVDKNGRAYDYTDEYRQRVNSLTADDIRKWAASHPDDPSLKSFIARGNSLDNLTTEQWRTGATDGKYGFMHHVADQIGNEPKSTGMTDEEFRTAYPMIARPSEEGPAAINWADGSIWQGLPGTTATVSSPSDAVDSEDPDNKRPKPYYTGLRYVPAIGAGIMSLTDLLGLTNKPDYTYADRLEAAAEGAGYAPNVSYDPVGNYLAYRPMDIWYEQNRLNANSRATDRAILNSGASQGSKMAGLLASGYNDQIASGNLYRNALEYNDAKRKDVAEFNRRTDMFNSQMGLEAAMANARYHQQASQMGLSGLAQAAALRDSIDARVGAARAANLTNLFNSLGDIGRENFVFNQINSDKSRQYGVNRSGVSNHKRKGK